MPNAPTPTEPADATAPSGRRLPGHSWARALAVGLVVAAAMVLLRTSALLEGPSAVAIAGLVALAVPTSRLLSRRILLAGALAFGAAPLLWLWDLPTGSLGRMTVVLAAASGALVGWVVWPDGAGRRARVRAIAPRLAPADGIPLLAALAAAVSTAPWWRATDGARAIGALAPGWDNSAHVAMVSTIRRYGTTASGVPELVGEHWSYQQYPQGFHTAVSAVMELLVGPVPTSTGTEVVAYLQASSLVLVAVTTMLVAGLAALPWGRRNAWPLVPAGLAVAVATTIVPGGIAYVGGFPNFVVAAALAGCAVLLAATMPRIALPLHLAALVSLLVAVAQGWLLLLVIAGPGVLVVVMRRRAWRADIAAWWWSAGVLVAGIIGLGVVASTVASLDPADVLVIPGGMVAHDPRVMIAVAVLTPGLVLLAALRHRRLAWLATGPAAGLVAAALLGAYQTATAGELSYYFWKLVLGLEIVDLVVVALVWVRLVPTWRPRLRGAHPAVALVGCAALAAALTTLEVLPWRPGMYGTDPSWAASATTIVQAADLAGPPSLDEPPAPVTVLTGPGSTFHPMSAQQWLLALTGRWTAEAEDRARALLTLAADGDVLAAAQTALASSPEARVVAPPELAAELRAQLGPDGDRVVSWG